MKWQLKFEFNFSECFIFHLDPDHSYGNHYLDSVEISPANIVKGLGVTMDSFLKFHEYINLTVSKTNRVLGKLFTVENQI